MRTCRILVVDDSPQFLATVGNLLEDCPGLSVVGRARSGQEGLELTVRLAPDLVLTDLQMPGIDGLKLVRLLASMSQSPRTVVMSLNNESLYRTAALEAGADGFVCKSSLAEELPPLIRRLLPGCGPEPAETD